MFGVGLMSVALVTVVSGEAYEKYAQEMFHSAFEYFGPDPVVAHIALPGREGWPDATLYRYHVLLENWHVFDGFEYVYMIDADMKFEAEVGGEILCPLAATLHPGYITKPWQALPYETQIESSAYARPTRSDFYYAGGFVGGLRTHFLDLVESVVGGIDADDAKGIMAMWHDESHLNRYLSTRQRPSLALSPSYCMPDDARGYPWLDGFERKIVALDKTPAERGQR